MTETRDGTIRDVLQELRRLSCETEEVNRRFDLFDRTGGTLDDFRMRVDCHEAEIVELRRQGELGLAPSPPLNQQARNNIFPISIHSGEGSTLPRFLNFFYWVLSSQSEDTLNHSHPIIMIGDNSRRELERECGTHIVAPSLIVWNALAKAVEKDKTIADIVVGAKAS